MGTELGPHKQMRDLAAQAATKYEMDGERFNERLETIMAEIEPYLAFDNFDKPGFISQIRGPLSMEAGTGVSPRRAEFLNAVAAALKERLDRL